MLNSLNDKALTLRYQEESLTDQDIFSLPNSECNDLKLISISEIECNAIGFDSK